MMTTIYDDMMHLIAIIFVSAMLSSRLVSSFTVSRAVETRKFLRSTYLRRFSTGLNGHSPTNSLARHKVKKIFEGHDVKVGDSIKVQGWVRTVRDQKKFAFIEVNDGSSLQ
eukprot:gene29269-35336_t